MIKLGAVSARATLFSLTLVWGSTFVVIQSAIEDVSPFTLVGVRFAIAAVTLFAVFPRDVGASLRLVPTTARLAVATFAGFALQTVGLQTTTPARSAFLTALMVVFVPMIETVRTRRIPPARLLVAVAVAAAGIVLLFWPVARTFVVGDGLTLLSAVAFADQIVETTRLGKLHSGKHIVAAQSLGIALLAVPFILWEGPKLVPTTGAVLAILYLSLLCTAANFLLLTAAQTIVAPTEASVIYTLEPVIASAFSIGLGRESVTLGLVLGGALVLAASLVATFGGAR